MLEKIRENKLIIGILVLIVISNIFTYTMFINKYNETLNIPQNTNDTNIISNSPGSSWNGDVTNNYPAITSVVKNYESEYVPTSTQIAASPAPVEPTQKPD